MAIDDIYGNKKNYEEIVFLGESNSRCNDDYFPVEGNEYCCPEPNMKIEGDYCVPNDS